MAYRVRDGLSYCRIDDQLVFLDVDSDRYFRLSEPLERAFIAHLTEGTCEAAELRKLIASRILTADAGGLLQPPEPTNGAPSRSFVEHPSAASKASMAQLIEVAAIVFSTRRQLASMPLRKLLDRLVTYRQRKLKHEVLVPKPALEQHLLNFVGQFWSARIFVPVPTRCLLDSLSMVRFLARRGFPACLVFGVTSEPFSPHCWAQFDDLVLTDSVGNVNAYTPIRTV